MILHLIFKLKCIQAYLRNVAGSVPDHHDKTNQNRFAGGGSCLQFVKITASVKRNKAKLNKRMFARP